MQNLFLVQSLLFPARNTCHTGTDKGSKNFVFSSFFINCFYFLHTITMVRTYFAETSTTKLILLKIIIIMLMKWAKKVLFF